MNNNLEFNERGKRIGWTCKRNHYWLIYNTICDFCGDERPNQYSILGTKLRIEYENRNDITFVFGRFNVPLRNKEEIKRFEQFYWSKEVDAKIELHMQFYNNQGTMNADRTDEELQEHLEELSNIAFEAKARIARTSDDIRERKTKAKAAAGLLQFSADEAFPHSDAISSVTERKKRMSKNEKLLAQMSDLLGVQGAADILGQINKSKYNPENVSVGERLTKSKQSKPTSEFCRIDRHDECVGSFRIEKESFTCSCKCHAPKVDWDDPFGLNGKSSNPTETKQNNAPILDLSFDDLMK